MLKKRIITSLLYDSDFMCVKPVAFERPYRRLGTMQQYMNVIERRNIDELLLLDICATTEGRGPQFEKLREICGNVFCPVTIGGGIRSLDDISQLLQCGADKVAIRTHTHLIYEVARKFGSQAIVGAVDSQFIVDGWNTYIIDDKKYNDITYLEHLGAGEILLTCMICDGRMQGYNKGLINRVSKMLKIPLIANGGCGTPHHMLEAFAAGANAVAAGSMFLYTDVTPRDCAEYLTKHGEPVRL